MIFAEDPGSANFLASLPPALKENRIRFAVFSRDKGAEVFRDRGIPLESGWENHSAALLLDQAKPKLLLVGTSENPSSLGLSLIKEAGARRIPTIGAVDAFMNAGFRFSGNTGDPLAFAPNYVLVPDQSTKNEFVAVGFSAERVMAFGHPHYDHVLSLAGTWGSAAEIRTRMFPGLLPGKKIVVFLSELPILVDPNAGTYAQEYTLRGRGVTSDRTEIVLEEFLDALKSEKDRPFVVLRIHPKDSDSRYERFLSELDAVSSGGNPLELVSCADLVVGLTSTLLLEAALLRVPTLSIVPRKAERDWLASSRDGQTVCVHQRSELLSALPSLMNGTREKSVRDFAIPGSTERVVDFLKGILDA